MAELNRTEYQRPTTEELTERTIPNRTIDPRPVDRDDLQPGLATTFGSVKNDTADARRDWELDGTPAATSFGQDANMVSVL